MVALGRFMMKNANDFKSDADCNNWARVGNMLVSTGASFGVRFEQFPEQDRAIALFAARVMLGQMVMPEKHVIMDVSDKPYRMRSARVTKAMYKFNEVA